MANTPEGFPLYDGTTKVAPFQALFNGHAQAFDASVANIRSSIGVRYGTAAARAAYTSAAPAGMLWGDTDGVKMLWRKDGAVWVPAVWRWGGTTAQMNAFTQAPNGFEWFNTTYNMCYVRSGGAWIAPPGSTFLADLTSATLPGGGAYTVLYNHSSWVVTNNLPGAVWNNGIKVAEAGLYQVTFSVLVATNINLFAVIKKNNTAANNSGGIVQQYVHQSTALSPAGGSISRTVKLAAGDRLVPALYTNGTAGPYGISPEGTSFAVTRV